MPEDTCGGGRKPPWLRVRLGGGPNYTRLNGLLKGLHLHTVCEEAMCPNKGNCWEHGRATILILGDRCTRNCTFCNVLSRKPEPPDPDEPRRVAEAVRTMGLGEVVITSVTRDDLPDCGATAWAATVREIHAAVPGILVEVLIPDFKGNASLLCAMMDSAPEVLGHNLETVPSLYSKVRPQADYERSLGVLRASHAAGLITKTGIMVGMGETADEVDAVMRDAATAGVEIFTVGQYLRPTGNHLPVHRYVEPAEFEAFRDKGKAAGLKVVVSAPLVRSSFHSDEQSEYVRSRIAIQSGSRSPCDDRAPCSFPCHC